MADEKQPKKLSSLERAKASAAAKARNHPGQIEGRSPGFKYYGLDTTGADPSVLKSRRAKLERDGWDLDPSAYVPASPGCEVWRIDDEAFEVLEQARMERRARQRELMVRVPQ